MADVIKRENIVDMALTFTAMVRVFEAGSKKLISEKLVREFSDITNISSRKEFDKFHKEFCSWFCNNIRTAEKSKNGRVFKSSKNASYGHAAKILDIVLKVYVYYSHLPDIEHSKVLVGFLHGAIDTPILEHLKEKNPGQTIKAMNISEIDEDQYHILQKYINSEIENQYMKKIYPVQYDDIVWNHLNRS